MEQFAALRRETRPAGLKLGMAGSLANLRAACRILERSKGVPRVIDPVLRSSSGAPLIDRKGAAGFLDEVAGRAELITPNLEEAGLLAGTRVRDLADMKEAARRIHGRTGMACLVKGGHLSGTATDVLFDGAGFTVFEKPRLGKKVHGTGCCLASAALAALARGLGPREACRLAVRFTGEAIRTAETASGRVSIIVLGRAA
jgi:hydroxymethylpyrimidine/phosphomethylpyrimidine kinase